MITHSRALAGYILSIIFLTFLSTLIPSSRYRASLALADAPEVRPCETCPRMPLRARSAWAWRIPRRRLNAFSLQYGLQYFAAAVRCGRRANAGRRFPIHPSRVAAPGAAPQRQVSQPQPSSSGVVYNLGNSMRRLALPEAMKHWSLTSLQTRMIKTGGRLVRHARRVVFQLAEVLVSREMLGGILERIGRLRLAPG